MSRLYKKAGGTFILKTFGLGIAFIFQIILGRMLNPELYGEYTMYLTYSTVFSIISILGMDRNLIKEVAKYEEDESKCKDFLKFSIKISFIITVLIAVILLLIRKYIYLTGFGYLLLLSMIIIRSIVALLDGYLQGKGLIVQVTILNSVFNNILKMILFIVFVVFIDIDSLNAALFSFIISESITIILRSKQVNKIVVTNNNIKHFLNKTEKTTFLKYSITVALISGIGLMLQNIDKIIISAYLDLSSVGIYKVAQNYVRLISVFVTPFIAFWPVISKLYNENKTDQIEVEMKKIVRIVTYLVIPMFFIFFILSDDLLRIFGEAYVTKEAKLALIILAFSFLIDAISGPIGSILTMTKYARYALYNNIISLLINVVLNLLLIERYGIVGVAIATGISIIANNLISIIEVKLLLGVFSYDFKNLFQILYLAIFNLVIIKIFLSYLSFDSIYLNVIINGLVLYFLNAILYFILNYKKIRLQYVRRRL